MIAKAPAVRTIDHARVSLVCLAALSLVACGGQGGDGDEPESPDQASACPTTFEAPFDDTRDVALGSGLAHAFEPYSMGDSVEVVLGNQGSFMITPSLRVAAAPADPENTCLRVLLTNNFGGALGDDPAHPAALQTNVRFTRQGDALFSDGALYDILLYSREALSGTATTLGVKVQGEGFEATSSVTIVLE